MMLATRYDLALETASWPPAFEGVASRLLGDALKQGKCAAAAYMTEDPRTGAWTYEYAFGEEAVAEVTLRRDWRSGGGIETLVMPVQELGARMLAGDVVMSLGSPRVDLALCLVVARFGWIPNDGSPYQEFDIGLLDLRGFSNILLSTHPLPDGRLLGPSMEEYLLAHAHQKQRSRLLRARKEMRKRALADPDEVLASGVAEHLLANARTSGLEPRRPLHAFWVNRVTPSSGRVENLVISSLTASARPLPKVATSGVNAVFREAWGVVNPDRDLGSTTKQVALPDDIEEVASTLSAASARRSPGGRARPAEDGEIHPHPDDPRQWEDQVGNLASCLADNLVPAEALITDLEESPRQIAERWRQAELDEQEISVLFQTTFTPRTQEEIAAVMGLSQSAVSRLRAKAEKKLRDCA